MIYKNLLLALIASLSLHASSSESNSENDGCCLDGDASSAEDSARRCSPRGNFAYELSGEFGVTDTTFREIGVISLDGFGNATARGTTVVGASVVQQPVYTCTYSLTNKLGQAVCSRTDQLTGAVTTPFNFAIAAGDCCNFLTLNVLPSPNTLFSIASISGTAQK